MRAVLRLAMTLVAAGLTVGPTTALAQDATQPAASAPPPATSNTVGPSDLQNFNLQGTVTRPAERPAAPPPTTPRPRPTSIAPATGASEPPTRAAERSTPRAAAEQNRANDTRYEPLRQTRPAPSVTVDLPQLQGNDVRASAAAPQAGLTAPSEPAPATLAPERSLPLWPWLLAAVALGAGGAFLLWRNRSRHGYAGGPQVDAFTAAEPQPQPTPPPTPRPVPAAPPAPPIAGIVATRLRPWIEIGFEPLQCVVDDDNVTIHFNIDLLNSGSAPARAVLAEASVFNAGATQDQAISAFFASPAGVGERIVSISPLKRVVVRTQVVAPRSQVQEYELAGRKVFVPVIAFNALYRWSSGEGQTSAAYLLGGQTGTDKLAPFKLDVGPRAFSAIAARPLPIGFRN